MVTPGQMRFHAIMIRTD